MSERESNASGNSDLGWYVYGTLQTTVLVASLYRWLSTEYWSFWSGFRELLWAVTPIVNFTYVLDWWL
ncbi:hypothetical protein N9448_01965 [Litorivicinus sp.]|nr:hypothetical protein [Litorivicinus sp.]